MKTVFSKICFPLAFTAAVCAQALVIPSGADKSVSSAYMTVSPGGDTIIYRNNFGSRLPENQDTVFLEAVEDTVPALTARDTIKAPDSLRLVDPFRYKYYVALVDSLTHRQVRDSLRTAGDSLDWPKLDSLYAADSIAKAKAAFLEWYNGLDKYARKNYDLDQKLKAKKQHSDSLLAVKDSLKAIKDSISESTPRILEAYSVPDSLKYKRIISWTHERDFHQLEWRDMDTTYQSQYNDYPFLRNDVNASWLGVAGSALQTHDWFKRGDGEGVSFYAPYESWSKSPSTLPMYNTKTPYTELAYYGTILANSDKESDNLRIFTSQNLYPSLNYTLSYERFGGAGMLDNETTKNKTFSASVNNLGKRHLVHAGYIYNMVSQEENGGITDIMWVRDTTVDAREMPVAMSNASTLVKKNTLFLDQQYRIPFDFINKWRLAKAEKADIPYRDSVLAVGDSLEIAAMEKELAARRKEREASLPDDESITTAYIGHSSEYTSIRRVYQDENLSDAANAFYNNAFYENPNQTRDSLRVSRLENRLFIRLQPWAADGVVSRLDAGLGNRIMNWYQGNDSYIYQNRNTRWNSTYIYAGAEGQLKDYIHWDAKGKYTLFGYQAADLLVSANASLRLYPFRRYRKSPLIVKAHFETSLTEPDYYQQHLKTNHYRWDNEFSKISQTKFQGAVSVPHWKLNLSAGYALLGNNIYYGTDGIIRQNGTPMSVLSMSAQKDFVVGGFLHLDNRALFQVSSNDEVMPLPAASLNLRYYAQFPVVKNVMDIQLGANTLFTTAWYAPVWNPATGAFQNQTDHKYGNCPYFDVFANIQWKRACIFVKMENAGQGWPMDKADYFSTAGHIRTQRVAKIGVFWPFYTQPAKANGSGSSSDGHGHGMSRSSH